MLDILFWMLVGSLVVVTLDPWSWRSNKPVSVKEKAPCRCFWCSG